VTPLLRNLFLIFLLVMTVVPCESAGAASKRTRLTGAWTISWQARVGMERGTIQFHQKGSRLTGVFQGHGSPASVSGNLKDGSVSFNLEFQGKTPYTIVFNGTLEGDKMTGKFQLQGFKDAYDQHGENVQQIDYSWTAERLPDSQKSSNQEQKPAR
jgi:hypothetical protein